MEEMQKLQVKLQPLRARGEIPVGGRRPDIP